MPPSSFNFADLWNGGAHDGIPVVVKMENPNWSMLELESPRSGGLGEKDRGKNAKQLTWVLLLKAHRAYGCLAWLPHGLWLLISAIKKRLILRQGVSMDKPHKLYRVIKGFLAVALVMLVFDWIAHSSGWHLSRSSLHIPSSLSFYGILQSVYTLSVLVRTKYIAPPLQVFTNICIALFLFQSLDKMIVFLGCVWIKLQHFKFRWLRFKGLPVAPNPAAARESEDLEDPGNGCPMVLVQIPMCNEREVYSQSISAVCQLEWPSHRLLVQVLDDSDDPDTQLLIQAEVQRWKHKGVNIVYRHRLDRTGYKAGNLKSAMECDYVKEYEFVAIFDADFQPKPDFLKLTVPHFKDDPDIALVQARWSFSNKSENLLTRFQNINLSFHFEVEQQVNGVFLNFFGFNGTAGVWRIKALEESGGWLERTTVEDMDIAVRAHLLGWKFTFLNDVHCLCELPESFEAYRKQQHRWHSGPMQLFRLCLPDIIRAKIPMWKKGNLIFLFFLLRKMILPFYSFTLFCIILPMTMFIPEVHLPVWVICHVPIVMSFLNILPAPSQFLYTIPYLVFENTMSVTKFNAMISGLFQLGSAYEWVVTKKTGRASASEADLLSYAKTATEDVEIPALHRGASESQVGVLTKLQELPKKPKKKRTNKLYRTELMLAFVLITAALRSLIAAQGLHFYYLLFQGMSFLITGIDFLGEQVS